MDRYKEQQELPKCNDMLRCRGTCIRMMYPHWPLSKHAIDVHLIRPENDRRPRWLFFLALDSAGLSFKGVLQRYGPLGYFMFAWIALFPSRQLDREIANGSALDVATMDIEPR